MHVCWQQWLIGMLALPVVCFAVPKL